MQRNEPGLWRSFYPVPKKDGHKYDRGHALIAGGEVMTGAARLAARAAQRMGAGLVTIAAPMKAWSVYAEALESVIVREANDIVAWQELVKDPKRNAILVGPGLGIGPVQKEFVMVALGTHKTCVLDADALTGFASEPGNLFAKLHEQCILTPHEGEFARLFGATINADLPKAERASQAAKLSGCVVLLKGAATIIAAPDGTVIVNDNAPPWLATAGAGDVLAGMILGLAAQSMPLFDAAAAAAWMHGEAATDFGQGLIAEDLVAGLPKVIQDLLA